MFVIRSARAKIPISFDAIKSLTSAVRNFSDENHPNIIKSQSSDVVIPEITVPEFFYATTKNYGDYIAVECSVTGKFYKFNDIRSKARNLAKFLRHKLRLQEEDVVAILLPNTPDYVIAALGIMEGNMITTSMNPFYTPGEISKQLMDSGTKLIITNSKIFSNAKAAVNIVKQQIPIVTIKTKSGENLQNGAISFEEIINTSIDIPDFKPRNSNLTTFLPYSSGTTGLPKGVQLSHNNITSNIIQSSHEDFNPYLPTSKTHQDVTTAVLPLFHIYGFSVVLLNSLANGCKVVTVPRFTPDLFISALEQHKVHLLFAAPPLVHFSSTHSGVKREYFKHLRNLTCGAAPLGRSDEEKFSHKFGNHVIISQSYGLTETAHLTSFPNKMKIKLQQSGEGRGSIGIPIPNTMIKVINPDDPSGTPLGPNTPGELLLKGPQVTAGYHKKPRETADAYLDGWFRSGDVVTYNEKGLIYVADRLKELIKVKGYQVAPAELEEIIRSYPNVKDAAVIGIPHPIDGEVPRAYVVLKDSQSFNDKDLQEFVAEKVTRYKRLRGGVEIVNEIPKSPSGKILRKHLKTKYE